MALVITDRPVEISVRMLDDERTPEGLVCLATELGHRIVARCVVTPEAAGFLNQTGLFGSPVRLALAAHEASPGLQCRLFAIVKVPGEVLQEEDEEEEEQEPWAASVPSSNFDRLIAESDDDEEDDGEHEAAVLLGHIVRFDRDRLYPTNLPLEAADILSSIVEGKVIEVVDKVIEDLLGDALDG